jgi:hypothetical protein
MESPVKLLRITIIAALFSVAGPLSATERGREFSAEGVGNFKGGGNRINVTLIADRFTSVEEAQQLAGILEKGGQGSLAAALRGRSDGRIRFGALERWVALVVAEPEGRGYRYLFLTPRRFEIHEREFGEESLNYPFGIAEFVVDGFGRGEGSLHVAAALRIDADGHIEVEDYDGEDGRLERIRQVR